MCTVPCRDDKVHSHETRGDKVLLTGRTSLVCMVAKGAMLPGGMTMLPGGVMPCSTGNTGLVKEVVGTARGMVYSVSGKELVGNTAKPFCGNEVTTGTVIGGVIEPVTIGGVKERVTTGTLTGGVKERVTGGKVTGGTIGMDTILVSARGSVAP